LFITTSEPKFQIDYHSLGHSKSGRLFCCGKYPGRSLAEKPMASISLFRAGVAQPCLVYCLCDYGDSVFVSGRLSDSCDAGSESIEAEEVGIGLCLPLCIASVRLVVLFHSRGIAYILGAA
jgi:hypothetical protein